MLESQCCYTTIKKYQHIFWALFLKGHPWSHDNFANQYLLHLCPDQILFHPLKLVSYQLPHQVPSPMALIPMLLQPILGCEVFQYTNPTFTNLNINCPPLIIPSHLDYGQYTSANLPTNSQAFGTWKETKAPGETPWTNRENVQTTDWLHQRLNQGHWR